MAGKIDRTIEPEIGEESAVKETSSGVRIRKKAKKKAVEGEPKPSSAKTEPQAKIAKGKLENTGPVVSANALEDEEELRSEKIIEDFGYFRLELGFCTRRLWLSLNSLLFCLFPNTNPRTSLFDRRFFANFRLYCSIDFPSHVLHSKFLCLNPR